MSYYAWILLGTLVLALLLSFHKKMAFYKNFKFAILSIFIVVVFFVLWDFEFTRLDVWGFNKKYVGAISLFRIPLEEIGFFIVIPFFSLVIYDLVKAHSMNLNFDFFGKIFGFATALSAIILAMIHMKQGYTLWSTAWSSLVVIGLCFQAKVRWFGRFAVAFTLCLIPLFVVGALLTGMASSESVIWYSEDSIMGIHLFTIPAENFYYYLGLILPTIAIFEMLSVKKTSQLEEGTL